MEKEDLVGLTADIVAAHVSNNVVPISDIGILVRQVHGALAALDAPAPAEPETPPAVVSIRASVRPDYLVCLICGRKQKTLKRHLKASHDLTPAAYRERFALRADYPMTAPNYAKLRSEMAHKIGLGRKGAAARKGGGGAAAKPARKGRKAAAKPS